MIKKDSTMNESDQEYATERSFVKTKGTPFKNQDLKLYDEAA